MSVFKESGPYVNFNANVHHFLPGMLELANPKGLSDKNEFYDICEISLAKGLQSNVKMDKQKIEKHNLKGVKQLSGGHLSQDYLVPDDFLRIKF